MKYTMSVLVENHPASSRGCPASFPGSGFNIDSLAVGVTEDPAISRMTIVVDGDEYVVEQLDKQLNKVIPVIKVKTLKEGDYIPRTLSLIKVSVGAAQRAEIMRVSELMGAKIVDATRTTMTIEFSDTAERTETLETLLRPYGIKEVVRTGIIAIEKGPDPTRTVKKNS